MKYRNILLGVFTITGLIALLLSSFVLPAFINDTNRDWVLNTQETIKSACFVVLGVLFIFYFLYSLTSKNIPKDKKYLWAALLFFGHIFVMPFFWYHIFWKNNVA